MFSVRLRTLQYRDFNIMTPARQQSLHNGWKKIIVSQLEKKKKKDSLILSILLARLHEGEEKPT